MFFDLTFLTKLKSGELEKLYLSDGYILKYNKKNNYFYLSKGGKRKYCLTQSFVKKYFTNKNKEISTKYENLNDCFILLNELLNNKKLGNLTKEKISRLYNIICKLEE